MMSSSSSLITFYPCLQRCLGSLFIHILTESAAAVYYQFDMFFVALYQVVQHCDERTSETALSQSLNEIGKSIQA